MIFKIILMMMFPAVFIGKKILGKFCKTLQLDSGACWLTFFLTLVFQQKSFMMALANRVLVTNEIIPGEYLK